VLPCVVDWALPCVWAPNLGEAVLKNLPPRQNWFLFVLRLIFFPSAPLCGGFRYVSSCVSLWLIARFIMALRAFGCPPCQLAFHCIWVSILRTRNLALHSGAHLANLCCVSFGRQSCKLALHCIRAPILPTRLSFCFGAHLASLPLTAFGCPASFSQRLPLWDPIFPSHLAFARPTCQLALPLCAHLANSPFLALWKPQFFSHMSRVAGSSVLLVGLPYCELTLHFIWVPNLGEVVLKNIPPLKNEHTREH
jgi:hypothetical protein